jgi:hypothetical protein
MGITMRKWIKMESWIGVDLDGTLAEYVKYDGTNIGEPVPVMLKRVMDWLAEGTKVKIFTARVSHDEDGEHQKEIDKWCKKHIGQKLEVTCIKDFGMIQLWDDRAVSVEKNTGEIVKWK